jgi:MazG family protein
MPYEEIQDPFRRLVRIMERLQEPGGCPWDVEQTHESLKPYMIEEAYEALDAIDRGDPVELAEELGDVLLQVVFHSVLAKRTGRFNIDEVIQGASTKMIRRHPHVFGETEARTAADVLRNWEKLKAAERKQKAEQTTDADAPEGRPERKGILSHLPQKLPALLRAQRLQEKAARVGFDWPNPEGVLDKIEEEIRELREAMQKNHELEKDTNRDRASTEQLQFEFGDILFSIVNLARFLRLDAEESLRQTCKKFQTRFEYIERQAAEQNRELHSMTLEEMDALWNEAKQTE